MEREEGGEEWGQKHMAGDRCTDSPTSLQVCKLGGAHGRLRSLGTGSGWPPKGCLHPLDRRLLDSLSSSPGSGGFRVHPRSTSAPWALGTQTVCSTGRRASHSRVNRHISTSTGQGCRWGKQTGRDLGVGFREQNRNTLAGGEQAPEEVGVQVTGAFRLRAMEASRALPTMEGAWRENLSSAHTRPVRNVH